MASNPSIILTDRDVEIFAALRLTPLEARQLLALSVTFKQPFAEERRVRRRLQKLAEAGFVSIFQYATTSRGATNYYKLTPTGYQLLQGNGRNLPHRSFFAEVSLARQVHTRALADFIVHTHRAAHLQGAEIPSFYRENELELTTGTDAQRPDAAFPLIYGRRCKKRRFVVEIDCGTEPIRSKRQRESLNRKVQFYERHRQQMEKPYYVLMIFTKESARLSHFLKMAYDTMANPDQSLFWATFLPFYLDDDSLRESLFIDQCGDMQSMIPSGPTTPQIASKRQSQLKQIVESGALVW